jgi:phosphonate transport system ATP-binding protein
MSTNALPVLQCPRDEVESCPLAVNVDGVWAAYGPGAPALRDVSLKVRQGERRAVVGPSGSGKSTMLKLLKGLVPATQGNAQTLGVSVCNRGGTKGCLRARVGYIPQNLGLVSSATVLQNALMGALHRVRGWRSWLGAFPQHEVDAAYEALDAVGIAHLAERKAHQLSGGERRRLAVARALVQRPELLLADEFLSELDDVTSEHVLKGLEAACERYGMTVLIVEHDLKVACNFCDSVTVLRDGKVVAEAQTRNLDEASLRGLLRG